jgi:hypothetical protein
MGIGIVECWVNGNNRLDDKIKMDNVLLITLYSIIPLLHYSVVDAKSQTSEIILYFD